VNSTQTVGAETDWGSVMWWEAEQYPYTSSHSPGFSVVLNTQQIQILLLETLWNFFKYFQSTVS
jgi:hypothetical protein